MKQKTSITATFTARELAAQDALFREMTLSESIEWQNGQKPGAARLPPVRTEILRDIKLTGPVPGN